MIFIRRTCFVPIVAEIKLALQNKAVKAAMRRVIHTRIVYDAALALPRGEGSLTRLWEELPVTRALSSSLDRQTLCRLTGAHGLIATTPEPNAQNRGAVCS